MKNFLTTLSVAAVFFSVVGNAQAQDANFDEISIQCSNGKYLSSENGEKAMSCNRDRVGDWEVFRVVILNNGFVLQTNPIENRALVRTSGDANVLTARGNTNNSRTIFSWGFPSSNSAIRTITRVSNSKLLSSENGEKPVTVTRDNVGAWEQFTIRKVN